MADGIDRHWMGIALAEARRGWGMTSPNPMVGAVVVGDGRELGRGYHERAGAPHAETVALSKAGSATIGATLYVTLEPCSTVGRTPPCTAAIEAAGIARVVVGCPDPNPQHRGRGIDILRDAGLTVDTGVLEVECRELNESFNRWITTGKPFVLLKMAMTLDGKIATAAGQSQWITGPEARAEVQRLRQWADAILVGGETVRCDDPSLTVREPPDWPRQPLRAVWTRSSGPDPRAKVNTGPGGAAMICKADGRDDWVRFLEELGTREVTALLVEGGGELAAAMLSAAVVDKLLFFVAPRILGGRDSRPVVSGPNPESLSEALDVTDVCVSRLGKDLLISGRPIQPAH